MDTDQFRNLHPSRKRKADSPLGRRHAARHRVLHARDGTPRLLAELSSRRFENSENRPDRKRLPRLLQNIRHRPDGQKSETGPFGSRKKIQENRPSDGKFHGTCRQRQPGPDRGSDYGLRSPLFRPNRNRVLLSDRRGRRDRAESTRPRGRIVRNRTEYPHADTRDALPARIRHPSVLCRARAGDRAGDRSGSSIP